MGNNYCLYNIYISRNHTQTSKTIHIAPIIHRTERPYQRPAVFGNYTRRQYHTCKYFTDDTGYRINSISDDVGINVF